MKKEAKPRGRPSKYTPELAAEICRRIADGETLSAICSDDGMPPASTVRQWALDDTQGFAALSARAYTLGFETLAERCLEIANTPLEGVETTTKPNGDVEEKRGDMLGHRKLQIDTAMRLLGKWSPKRYGEKIQQEHSGEIGVRSLAERMRKRSQSEQ